jgi:hypothetical protein
VPALTGQGAAKPTFRSPWQQALRLVKISCTANPIGRPPFCMSMARCRHGFCSDVSAMPCGLGTAPGKLHLLSHEDVPDFQPLNTVDGQWLISQTIDRIGSVDLVVFDNIMSLTKGDFKEGDSWHEMAPLVRSLTKRNVSNRIRYRQTGLYN